MKITIIGPLCSGKSTLGEDLNKQLNNSILLEEAYRIFYSQGIVVPISEDTTQESTLMLFNYSCNRLRDLSNEKNYIILGPPFDEYMYTEHAVETFPNTDLNDTFLLSLQPIVRKTMREFDLILKVENFQNIPYYNDNVRPDKTAEYRETVNNTINKLLIDDHLLDADTLRKIKIVSGSREERVQQALTYIEEFKLASSISNVKNDEIKVAQAVAPHAVLFPSVRNLEPDTEIKNESLNCLIR